ncbi:helix-turn-helix transcriptional regulator [Spirillospora sp. NBC_00431]
MKKTKKRTFTCGLDAAIAVMGGKWKGLILFALQDGPLRFGELRRAVPGISERVLILQLREMEATGLLHREVYHQVPPKVEYSLTEFGHSLNTAMAPLGEWGERNIERIEMAVAPAEGAAEPDR